MPINTSIHIKPYCLLQNKIKNKIKDRVSRFSTVLVKSYYSDRHNLVEEVCPELYRKIDQVEF